MKKLYNFAIFTCIILSISVCGCGDAEQKNVTIKQSNKDWKIKDIPLKNLPEDACVVGITQEGVYYRQNTNEDKTDDNVDVWIETYHFLNYSGEDEEVDGQVLSGSKNRGYYTNGDHLFISVDFGGNKGVWEITLDGWGGYLLVQNTEWMPYLQGSKSYILYINDVYLGWNYLGDYVDEYVNEYHDKLKKEYEYDKGYECENRLVLRQDELHGEETTICQVVYDVYWEKGETILSASVNDEEVFYVTEVTEDGQSQYWLHTYDIAQKKNVDKVSLERQTFYAVCMNDFILLSENDDANSEGAGRIGKNVNGVFEETAKLPLITSSNKIQDGLWVEDGVFLRGIESGYFWKKKSNTIYVFDFTQMNDGDCVVGDYYIIEDGFVCVIQKEDGYYVRQIELK